MGFVLRLEGMETFDQEIQNGRFKQVVSRKRSKPFHDTLRKTLCQWNLDHLDQCHDQFVAKFNQNRRPHKGNIDGWRIGAIDGHNCIYGHYRK